VFSVGVLAGGVDRFRRRAEPIRIRPRLGGRPWKQSTESGQMPVHRQPGGLLTVGSGNRWERLIFNHRRLGNEWLYGVEGVSRVQLRGL